MYHFNIKKFPVIGLLALCFLTINLTVTAQENVHSRWAVNVPEEASTVNHTPMTTILGFITESSNKQDTYSYYKLQGRALKYVKQYKTYLSNIPVSQLNKDEQLAFWLNLHNVLVIEKIAENTKKAKRLKNRRGTPTDVGKWWSEKVIAVETISLSINDIEQQVLIQNWADPLVIYGLFYGVKGQGFSGYEAFTRKKVYKQLATLATSFLNKEKNVDVRKSEVRLSSLLVWNKATLFNDDDQKMLTHVRKYATGTMQAELLNVKSVSKKHKFDWKNLIFSAPRNQQSFSSGSSGGYKGGS